MNSYSIFNIHIQFVSIRKRFSVSPARELPTHVLHTPLARVSLFAGNVYLRVSVAQVSAYATSCQSATI